MTYSETRVDVIFASRGGTQILHRKPADSVRVKSGCAAPISVSFGRHRAVKIGVYACSGGCAERWHQPESEQKQALGKV